MNGGRFDAVGIVPDPAFPGYHIPDTNVTLHYGPPAGIILKSKSTTGLEVPCLPDGTVFPGKKNHTMRVKERAGGLKVKCVRCGLPCTPGIAMTDFKSQGGTMTKVRLGYMGATTTRQARSAPAISPQHTSNYREPDRYPAFFSCRRYDTRISLASN